MQITRGVSQWVKKNPESHRADRHIYYTPNSCTSSGGGITYYVNKLFFSLFLLLTFAFLFLFFFDWFFWLAKDLHRFAVALCGPVAVGHFLIYQWPGQKRQSIEQSHSLIKCKHLFNCHASMQTAQLGAAFNGAWQFCQVNRIIRDAHKRKTNKTKNKQTKFGLKDAPHHKSSNAFAIDLFSGRYVCGAREAESAAGLAAAANNSIAMMIITFKSNQRAGFYLPQCHERETDWKGRDCS